MSGKITWQDIHEATFKELKNTYKLTDRQLEQGVRRHMDGASMEQRNELYRQVWGKKE